MLNALRRGGSIGFVLLLLVGAGCGASTPTAPAQPEIPAGWQTTTDAASGIAFAHPPNMQKTYLDAPDWPPRVQVLNEEYRCLEAGTSEAVPAGLTKEHIVNGRAYCVTTESEGAAGNYYSTYAYAFPKDQKTVILTFSIHTVQCLNYAEPQQSACKEEQSALNVDGLVDGMAQTLR